ncbi:Intersectin-2 [Balamuthia mandrillaris]
MAQLQKERAELERKRQEAQLAMEERLRKEEEYWRERRRLEEEQREKQRKQTMDDENKRKTEVEARWKVEEQRRKDEEQRRKEEEQKRKEEERRRKAAEDMRQEEASKRVAAEKEKQLAEQKLKEMQERSQQAERQRMKLEEEKRRVEEQLRRKEEERLKAEAEKESERRREEERKRKEEEQLRKEAQQRITAAEQRKQEAEKQRKELEEEKRRLLEEIQRKEKERQASEARKDQEWKRKQEEEKKSMEQRIAEAEKRRAEAEALKKQMEEERARLEMEMKQREEEKRRQTEAECKREAEERRKEEERRKNEEESIRKEVEKRLQEAERRQLELEEAKKKLEEERKQMEHLAQDFIRRQTLALAEKEKQRNLQTKAGMKEDIIARIVPNYVDRLRKALLGADVTVEIDWKSFEKAKKPKLAIQLLYQWDDYFVLGQVVAAVEDIASLLKKEKPEEEEEEEGGKGTESEYLTLCKELATIRVHCFDRKKRKETMTEEAVVEPPLISLTESQLSDENAHLTIEVNGDYSKGVFGTMIPLLPHQHSNNDNSYYSQTFEALSRRFPRSQRIQKQLYRERLEGDIIPFYESKINELLSSDSNFLQVDWNSFSPPSNDDRAAACLLRSLSARDGCYSFQPVLEAIQLLLSPPRTFATYPLSSNDILGVVSHVRIVNSNHKKALFQPLSSSSSSSSAVLELHSIWNNSNNVVAGGDDGDSDILHHQRFHSAPQIARTIMLAVLLRKCAPFAAATDRKKSVKDATIDGELSALALLEQFAKSPAIQEQGNTQLLKWVLAHPCFYQPSKAVLAAVEHWRNESGTELQAETIIHSWNCTKVNFRGKLQERVVVLTDRALHTFAYHFGKQQVVKSRVHRYDHSYYDQVVCGMRKEGTAVVATSDDKTAAEIMLRYDAKQLNKEGGGVVLRTSPDVKTVDILNVMQKMVHQLTMIEPSWKQVTLFETIHHPKQCAQDLLSSLHQQLLVQANEWKKRPIALSSELSSLTLPDCIGLLQLILTGGGNEEEQYDLLQPPETWQATSSTSSVGLTKVLEQVLGHLSQLCNKQQQFLTVALPSFPHLLLFLQELRDAVKKKGEKLVMPLSLETDSSSSASLFHVLQLIKEILPRETIKPTAARVMDVPLPSPLDIINGILDSVANDDEMKEMTVQLKQPTTEVDVAKTLDKIITLLAEKELPSLDDAISSLIPPKMAAVMWSGLPVQSHHLHATGASSGASGSGSGGSGMFGFARKIVHKAPDHKMLSLLPIPEEIHKDLSIAQELVQEVGWSLHAAAQAASVTSSLHSKSPPLWLLPPRNFL